MDECGATQSQATSCFPNSTAVRHGKLNQRAGEAQYKKQPIRKYKVSRLVPKERIDYLLGTSAKLTTSTPNPVADLVYQLIAREAFLTLSIQEVF